jgi:lysophospholipase L1-like esterase
MLGLCDELDLLCLDLLPGLQERARKNEALYYEDDMHLNPHGNLVVAALVAAWLGENGWLPQR